MPSADRAACLDQAIVLQEKARGAVSYARAVRTHARETVAASQVVSAQCRVILAEARRLRTVANSRRPGRANGAMPNESDGTSRDGSTSPVGDANTLSTP